jgi:hypothetical protein
MVAQEHPMDGAPRQTLFYRQDCMVQQELERHVHIRTGRRVRNLTVELHPERVVLHGRADSYYVKQLAQQGVRDLLPDVCLQNAIAVENHN